MHNLFTAAIPACTITLGLLSVQFFAAEDSEISWRTFEVGLLASTHNLEGPAVTGPSDEQEGEDEGGFGIYSRVRYGFANYFHITADLSAEQIASDVSLVRGVVAPGVHWDFSPTWSIYGETVKGWPSSPLPLAQTASKDYDSRAPAATNSDGGSVWLHRSSRSAQRRPFKPCEWHISLGLHDLWRNDLRLLELLFVWRSAVDNQRRYADH